VDSPVSTALFVRRGRFQWFFDEDYQVWGHITPIQQWYLEKCAAEAGFRSRWQGSFGDPFRITHGRPRLRALAKLLTVTFPRGPGLEEGEILVTVLEKPAVP
jgi:hypothetical protein